MSRRSSRAANPHAHRQPSELRPGITPNTSEVKYEAVYALHRTGNAGPALHTTRLVRGEQVGFRREADGRWWRSQADSRSRSRMAATSGFWSRVPARRHERNAGLPPRGNGVSSGYPPRRVIARGTGGCGRRPARRLEPDNAARFTSGETGMRSCRIGELVAFVAADAIAGNPSDSLSVYRDFDATRPTAESGDPDGGRKGARILRKPDVVASYEPGRKPSSKKILWDSIVELHAREQPAGQEPITSTGVISGTRVGFREGPDGTVVAFVGDRLVPIPEGRCEWVVVETCWPRWWSAPSRPRGTAAEATGKL